MWKPGEEFIRVPTLVSRATDIEIKTKQMNNNKKLCSLKNFFGGKPDPNKPLF